MFLIASSDVNNSSGYDVVLQKIYEYYVKKIKEILEK